MCVSAACVYKELNISNQPAAVVCCVFGICSTLELINQFNQTDY